MRRRAVLMAALAGACLVVAGCGGSDGPPRADPAPSPSATVSPSPTAPVLPAAARANTKAGAVAFARHYVDLINHAQATGDVTALAAVESASCGSCRSVRKFLAKLYGGGGSITGGAWHIQRVIGALRNPENHAFNVDLLVEFGRQRVRHVDTSVDNLKGGHSPVTVFLSRRGAEWKVDECTRGR